MSGHKKQQQQTHYDAVVIGGGINGAGIARDAAGRGLSVVLCEKDDLAQGTSSRSGKLVHGGEVSVHMKDGALAFEITPAAPKKPRKKGGKPAAEVKA